MRRDRPCAEALASHVREVLQGVVSRVWEDVFTSVAAKRPLSFPFPAALMYEAIPCNWTR